MGNVPSAAARLTALGLLTVLLLPAAAKKTAATARGENEDLILTVTLHIDPADIKGMVGSDLESHYIIADVNVEPKYGKEVSVDIDDFQLRTDKDGEKTKPFVASQIAGRGALIISKTAGPSGGGGVSVGDPMGYPGGYPPNGYPPYGYPDPAGMGADTGRGVDAGGDTGATATVRNSARDKVNPLEKKLDELILANGKTDKPVHGLLYFPMEKQKMKDLELLYGGRENRIRLRFK